MVGERSQGEVTQHPVLALVGYGEGSPSLTLIRVQSCKHPLSWGQHQWLCILLKVT